MGTTEPARSSATTFLGTVLADDDGSLTSPTAVGASATMDSDAFMSDEEGKIITTLEAAPKQRSPSCSREKVIIHNQTTIKPANATPKTPTVSVGNGSSNDGDRKTDDLLARMKSRLSKQIDLKMIPSNKPKQSPHQGQMQSAVPLDSSGSIEIPHDLILSSEIPATPLATSAAARELEDHDLIAILEGDDVETTEIEVRVGGSADDGIYNDDQVLEEIQISFVDETEMDVEQRERDKEIAMRQMANLPILPKGRRPKPKPQETGQKPIRPVGKPNVGTESAKSTSVDKKESTSLVTIKGQTTIKPLPKPMMIPKKEPEDIITPRKLVAISKPAPKISSTPQSLPTLKHIASTPITPKQSVSPSPTKQSPNELISSLVSDWDDEPIAPKIEPISPDKAAPKPKPANLMAPPPPPPQIPTSEEPVKRSRVIKKKIIWDPDNPETHMSFASFVKSNRTVATTDDLPPPKSKSPTLVRPAGSGIRRKRAESVAVHMIKDPPYIPPSFSKRARTPEPQNKIPKLSQNVIKTTNSISKKKSKSEIEKLLGDEGAINMLYDLEKQHGNADLLKESELDEVDSEDEDEKLLAKAKIITDVVIKQGTSPSDSVAHAPRVRTKRASTPQKTFDTPAPIASVTTTSVPSNAGVTRKNASAGNGPGRKRKQASGGTSGDWDYVYNSRKTCDDAMIIRRRSNSSYSSSTSPRRLSVEQPVAGANVDTNFEFIKPNDKVASKPTNIKLDSSLVANMKGKLSKALGTKVKKESSTDPLSTATSSGITGSSPEKKMKPKAAKSEITTTTVTSTVRIDENGLNAASTGELLENKITNLKLVELSCKLCSNYAEIVLAPNETKLRDVFSIELLNDLKAVLNLLKGESSVRAVLIRSSNKHFCRGIDVSYLVQTNADKRKNAAQVLSGHLRNFLQTLAMFNKPLIAAVHGDVLGLGVTMLPLFDAVIAPEGSTFSTPYGIFGHMPEALKIFTTAKYLKPKAITDMLYLCKKVSATTAMDFGIVSDVVPSEKLQDKANSVTKKMASLSAQALKSIKINIRQELLARLDDQLTAEQKKLSQQWITVECQEKFKMFLSRGGEW